MRRFLSILPLVFGLGMANATDTPVSASFLDFSGGLNDYQAPMYIAKNESPDLLNVVIDEPMGALTQRKGYQSCGTTPSGNTATALYEYVTNDGARHRIVSDNVTVWSTADCVTYSTITTGLSSFYTPRFATINNRLWIVNGSTYPYVWDTSTGWYLDGTSNHPTAPKGKYIAYWKSRVFLANTPTEPSSVYFSQLTDTNGTVLDPAVSTMAWASSLNVLYINRGDGSPIYGEKLYKDNLYIFKETGVNRIVFESEYSIQIGKNVTTIGSKFNDAIVETDDGLLRYPGRDGLYAFNGVTASKISTKWTNLYKSMQQPTSGEQYNLWDSSTDWIAGSLLNTSTAYQSGPVSLSFDISSRAYDHFTDLSKWTFGTGSNYFSVIGGAMRYNSGYTAETTGEIYTSTSSMNWGSWTFNALLGQFYPGGVWKGNETWYYITSDNSATSASNGYAIHLKLKGSWTRTIEFLKATNGTLSVLGSSSAVVTPNLAGFYFYVSASNVSVNISDTGAISVKENGIEKISATDSEFVKGTSKFNIFKVSGWGYASPGFVAADAGIDEIYKPGNFTGNGTYTAQAYNATSMSSWKTFDVASTLNSQSISYSMRVATSAYNLSNTAYTSITPGSIVSACSTCTWAQWKANFSTTDNTVSPLLNSASIGWLTGATINTQLTAANYNGRYWMAASTTTGGSYNDMTVVESKPPLTTFTKYDLPIGAFVLWDNTLYGSIGGTGKIARLDYGDTDDGRAIHSYWASRDEMFDSPYFYKSINMSIADYSNSPANTGVNIGLSPDMGDNYQNRTLDISASSLPRNTKKLNYDANRALGFRARIDNTTLGIGYKIYGLHLFGTQNGFLGN